ncbi:MAG TPA: hypothetical protein DEH78_21360 [Solibacterales bacterium]|nr:hypothetical protein [Bryobacterales bacterium]
MQRLKLPSSLYKHLATSNAIENAQGGVARRTGNVTRWRRPDMVERWAASAWLLTEQRLPRVGGRRDLWALATILGPQPQASPSNVLVA